MRPASGDSSGAAADSWSMSPILRHRPVTECLASPATHLSAVW